LERNRHFFLWELCRVDQIFEEKLAGVFDESSDLDTEYIGVGDGGNTAVVTNVMDVVRSDVRFHEVLLLTAVYEMSPYGISSRLDIPVEVRSS
jgi:hypothetical protein